MVGHHSRAIVLKLQRLAARRLARILVGAGYVVEAREEPGDLLRGTQGSERLLLLSDAEDSDAVLQALKGAAPSGRCAAIFCCSSDPLEITDFLEIPEVHAFLGVHPGGGSGLEFEAALLAVALNLRGLPLPPMQAHLLWGAQAFHTEIGNVTGREAAVMRIVELCAEQLGTQRRIADSAGEVAHELITNAMYDAPVDAEGGVRYARDRSTPIELATEDRVAFRYGTDGMRLAIEASDRFGRLSRSDLNQSLRRGASGQVNQGEGGAGIGLSRVFRACQTLQIDVIPGVRSRVTAVIDLDPPRPAEAAGRAPCSLIFPPQKPEESQGAGARVTLGPMP